jgi:hypothetical protein
LRGRAWPASDSRAIARVSTISTAGGASVRPPWPRPGRVNRGQELALRGCHSHPSGRVSKGGTEPGRRRRPRGACLRGRARGEITCRSARPGVLCGRRSISAARPGRIAAAPFPALPEAQHNSLAPFRADSGDICDPPSR